MSAPECKLSAEIFCYPQGILSRRYLLRRQNFLCAKCGKPERWGEIDHIIPIYKGGTALGTENLQLLCSPCHAIKTAEDRKRE